MNQDIHTNLVLMGRYQVQRELGRGGMGAVYLAFDLQHRKSVAIKVARLAGPEARAQFRREALYLQKLHHHSLPRVWDVFSDTQRDFLVMEYIPGDDLETLVQTQGPQPEWLVLRWADELLDVLDYLHTQDPPIIHRDVKPGNLKLRENGMLVLVDFGIAAEHRPEQDALVGMTAVTPGYSPPEQYTDSPADARTDVFGAGATLYYLLTGVAPAAAPERASGAATLAPARKLVAKITANTDALLSKALHLASEERWANAAEMRRAAAVASRKLVSAAPAPPQPDVLAPVTAAAGGGTVAAAPGKRRVGCAVASGLVGVALLAVTALLWMTSMRQPSASSSAQPMQTSAGVQAANAPDASATATTIAPSPTATAVKPSPTATLEAQGTVVEPTSLVSPTSTPIATHTSTPDVESGTATATPTVRPTRTRLPTATSQSATASSAPAAASPTAPATATAVATATAAPSAPPTPSSNLVNLIEPGVGAVGSGVRLFHWQASQAAAANQGYELVFWRPGQNAMGDAFGPIGVTQDSSGQMRVDLDKADLVLGALFDPGDYLWGVMLVETSPYRRIALVSEARAFRFERSGGGQPGDPPPPPQSTPDPG